MLFEIGGVTPTVPLPQLLIFKSENLKNFAYLLKLKPLYLIKVGLKCPTHAWYSRFVCLEGLEPTPLSSLDYHKLYP